MTPENYEELPESERLTCVPISVCDTAADGMPVPREWFEDGVKPAADVLRRLAAHHLGDRWRASELAETVVLKLARSHGSDTGRSAKAVVIAAAKWEAKTLAAGDQYSRQHPPLEYTEEAGRSQRNTTWVAGCEVKAAVSREMVWDNQAYREGLEWESARIDQIRLDQLDSDIAGRPEIQNAFRMLRAGCTWTEIQGRLGLRDRKSLLAFKKAFYRYVKPV